MFTFLYSLIFRFVIFSVANDGGFGIANVVNCPMEISVRTLRYTTRLIVEIFNIAAGWIIHWVPLRTNNHFCPCHWINSNSVYPWKLLSTQDGVETRWQLELVKNHHRIWIRSILRDRPLDGTPYFKSTPTPKYCWTFTTFCESSTEFISIICTETLPNWVPSRIESFTSTF